MAMSQNERYAPLPLAWTESLRMGAQTTEVYANFASMF